MSNLKSKVDKLHIGKIETTPVHLSKLSNLVKNDVVKKTKYTAKIKNIEDKTPNKTNFATKTTLNAKINEVKAEIPSVNNLATNTALTAVENKMPDVSVLATKTDTKGNEIEKKITDHSHNEYITTPEFNKLTTENFAAGLAQTNLVTQTGFDEKLKNLNKKLTQGKQNI